MAEGSRISSGDFAGLQKAILALYSHRDLESFRKSVPDIFMSLIPAQHFMLANLRPDPVNRRMMALDLWESPEHFVGERREAMERNLFDHPFVVHVRKHRVTGALRLSDFLTLPQLRKTRLYREAMKPAGRGRTLSIGAHGGPGMATLTLSRPETEPDFTERDRALLEMLRPHFDQARASLERETLLRANRAQLLKTHGMTPREIEVALWLAQGKSNQEIANILDATSRTIEKHVEHILRKMGVENRAAAAIAMAGIIRG